MFSRVIQNDYIIPENGIQQWLFSHSCVSTHLHLAQSGTGVHVSGERVPAVYGAQQGGPHRAQRPAAAA